MHVLSVSLAYFPTTLRIYSTGNAVSVWDVRHSEEAYVLPCGNPVLGLDTVTNDGLSCLLDLWIYCYIGNDSSLTFKLPEIQSY